MAEVARRRKVPLPKRLDLDENFKLKHTLFCCDIKNCRDLRTLGKKVLFWSNTVFIGQEVKSYMVYIAY